VCDIKILKIIEIAQSIAVIPKARCINIG